jgi:hypothetical protein
MVARRRVVKKKKKNKKIPARRNINRIISNQAFLRFLCYANAKERRRQTRLASKGQVLCICECAYNLMRQNVPLSPEQIRQLRKVREIVYTLADKSVPLEEKHSIINTEQGGGALPFLVAPIIATLLGEVVSHFVK